jgi:hypothetical protein
VPAATPKSDAVRLRMFEMTCGESESVTVLCRIEAMQWRSVEVIDKRTWVLCWTLLATIGLMASSRSSFNADAAMAGYRLGLWLESLEVCLGSYGYTRTRCWCVRQYGCFGRASSTLRCSTATSGLWKLAECSQATDSCCTAAPMLWLLEWWAAGIECW